MTEQTTKFSAGETVIRKTYYGAGQLVEIDRVTPSGRIVCGSETFKPSGCKIGRGEWSGCRIEKVTPSGLEAIKREKNISFLSSFKMGSLSTHCLDEIISLIKKERP